MLECSKLLQPVLSDGVRIFMPFSRQFPQALFPVGLIIGEDFFQFLRKSLDVVHIHVFEAFRIDSLLESQGVVTW